jgi:hypothetical protein
MSDATPTVIPSADVLAALEAQHRRIAVVTDPDATEWCIVVRKPKASEYKRFRATLGDSAKSSGATEQLVRDTCVLTSFDPAGGPQGSGLNALLEEWPGAADACGKALVPLSGLASAEQGKG